MPWGAAATVASAVIGGVVSSNAADKAGDAASHAADQNAAVNREIYQQTRSDLQPYTQGGYGALGQLQREYGLGTPPPSAGANSNLPAYMNGPARGNTPGGNGGAPPALPAIPPGTTGAY